MSEIRGKTAHILYLRFHLSLLSPSLLFHNWILCHFADNSVSTSKCFMLPRPPPMSLSPLLPSPSHSQGQVSHSPKTGCVAVVVTNDDGRIQGLEIQDQDWVRVEFRFRFQNQRQTLRSRHSGGGVTIRTPRKLIRTPNIIIATYTTFTSSSENLWIRTTKNLIRTPSTCTPFFLKQRKTWLQL